jgi:recombination protein RecT
VSTALASLRDRQVALANSLEQARERLLAVIPVSTGLTPSRAIAVVLDAVSRDPSLLECHAPSVVRSVVHAAEIGLELGSPLGEAYLVPFKNSRKGFRKEASMIAGYKGLIKLAKGSPRVSHIEATLVREKDVFEYERGTSPRIVHKPGAGTLLQRGEVLYAYAVVAYVDGLSQFEVMDRVELDRIKSNSRGTPWRDHTDEMYRKCPIRRIAKSLDLNPLARRAVEIDTLEEMRRGEIDAPFRDGLEAGRAKDLRDMIAKQRGTDAKVGVIDADFEEEPS